MLPERVAASGRGDVIDASAAQGNTRAALRVLLVEDSEDDAKLVLTVLRRGGFDPEYRQVEDAAKLQAALRAEAWDLILCDYAMPRFDALAALAVLKAEAVDIPFIIVSGTMGEDTAVRAMKAGAHDFFCKDKLTLLPAAIARELRDANVRAERRKMQDQLLLSDRLVAVGTLAAGVAHEINNPLAYVIGNLEFAIERLAQAAAAPGNALQEAMTALQQAREGAERIRVTTRDLKVFCRSADANQVSVDVERVLESSISMAWNEIRHRARLVRDFTSPLPRVDGNENRLGQVFLNLLINAAQAIGEDEPGTREIKVSTRCDASHVFVEIRDNGIGMSSEVQARLFEPFFTTKPIGIGTGLGLPICNGIVSDLGGKLSIESQLGVGTCVRVTLPIGNIVSAKQASVPAEGPTRAARVLIIDDEPALCQIVQRLLRPDNEVVIANTARAGLAVLAADPSFDAILCDLMMPEMTGMEFHAELTRSAPQLAERVTFLSGGACTERAARFLESVPNRRLEKPFDASSLRAAIAKSLADMSASTAIAS
jgi:signal transduction histidine kinase